nr:hypothetical protein [uncultured bacterium]
MAKNRSLNSIFVNKEKYELLVFKVEDDFENHIKNRSESFFENAYVFNFKYTLKTNNHFQNNVRADLLVVDKDYRFWTIVEVEYYSKKKYQWLSRHVIPQMNKITNINYSVQAKGILGWLKKQKDYDRLDSNKLRDLLLYNRPGFLVVINAIPDNLTEWCTSLYECDIVVLKTFKNMFNTYLYTKDFLKRSDEESLIVKPNKYDKMWLIDKPSLIMNAGTKHILVVEEDSKNIFKFRVGSIKNLLIQQSGQLTKDRYWLKKAGSIIKFIKK